MGPVQILPGIWLLILDVAPAGMEGPPPPLPEQEWSSSLRSPLAAFLTKPGPPLYLRRLPRTRRGRAAPAYSMIDKAARGGEQPTPPPHALTK
jgi:hypothetical protein